MTTITGTMATDRPERHARQLVSHWAERMAQVVKDHLERFGSRDELNVVVDD
jgi:hypothetical protein